MNNIRQLRRQKNIDVEGLAAQLGVTTSTIYNWETGKVIPGPAQMRALRSILGDEATAERVASKEEARDRLIDSLQEEKARLLGVIEHLVRQLGKPMADNPMAGMWDDSVSYSVSARLAA